MYECTNLFTWHAFLESAKYCTDQGIRCASMIYYNERVEDDDYDAMMILQRKVVFKSYTVCKFILFSMGKRLL